MTPSPWKAGADVLFSIIVFKEIYLIRLNSITGISSLARAKPQKILPIILKNENLGLRIAHVPIGRPQILILVPAGYLDRWLPLSR